MGIFGAIGWAIAFMTTLTAGEIELRGTDGEGTELFLSLKNTRTGVTDWIKIGGRFSGYTVRSYDEKRSSAELAKDGETLTISIAGATIGKPQTITPDQQEEVKKAVLNNLRQLSAAADQYYLEQGVDQVKFTQLVGKEPNKYIKELKALDGEDYSKIELKQGKPMKVKTKSGIEVEYQN